MSNTIDSVGNSGAPMLNVAGDQGGDAIGQINELMVSLGQLFGKLRDLLRQYNQSQQANAFTMQKTSFDTRKIAIEKEFDAKNWQAIGQMISGGLQATGGATAGYGASKAPGTPMSWLAGSGDIGKGAGSFVEGAFSKWIVNPRLRESQENQAKADYQHSLADQLLKRSDETLEKALKASSDLRELLNTLTQAHERIAGSVRMS